jgi:hypothetical protein
MAHHLRRCGSLLSWTKSSSRSAGALASATRRGTAISLTASCADRCTIRPAQAEQRQLLTRMRLLSGVGSSFVVMSLRQRVVAVLAVVALSVTGTLIVVELTKSDRIVLPAGCSPADRGSPGCRPVTESGADATTLTLLGVPFTLLAALGAAGLTARSANARQRASLAAESERQSVALQAEAERHLATLRHERGLADRAELRAVLDALMEHIAVADRNELAFESARYAYEHDSNIREEAEVMGKAAARVFTQATFALEPYRDRLRARLGAKHELAVAFDRLFEDLSSVGQVMGKVTWPATSEHEQWIRDTKWAYLGRRDEFFDTAARFVGTQVSE